MENLNFRSDWDGYETLTEEELSRVSGGRDNSHHKGWSLTAEEQRILNEAAARRARERAEEAERRRRAAELWERHDNATGGVRRRGGYRHDEL